MQCTAVVSKPPTELDTAAAQNLQQETLYIQHARSNLSKRPIVCFSMCPPLRDTTTPSEIWHSHPAQLHQQYFKVHTQLYPTNQTMQCSGANVCAFYKYESMHNSHSETETTQFIYIYIYAFGQHTKCRNYNEAPHTYGVALPGSCYTHHTGVQRMLFRNSAFSLYI